MTKNIHTSSTPCNGSRAHPVTSIEDRDTWACLLLRQKVRGLGALSSAAKVVGHFIALHIDLDTSCCQLSCEQIADHVNMDPRATRRMIRKLEDAGWLGVERAGGGHFSNVLSLRVPDTVSASFEGGHADV
jgi:Winged helix-turn-helix DNA-binding